MTVAHIISIIFAALIIFCFNKDKYHEIYLSSIFELSCWATAPIILSKLKKTDLKQEQCLEQAEQALKHSGFTENFAQALGDNSGHIRCVSVEQMVLLVVAGKLYNKAGDLFRQLDSHF